MPFPLDPEFVKEFAEGLETILVVEEKRSFLEMQLREMLYDQPARPAILGKSHFPPTGELDPDKIAKVLCEVLEFEFPDNAYRRKPAAAGNQDFHRTRPAAFCSGCPHNRSTVLLDGQIAGGGIGCHTMAMRLNDSNRNFVFMTHMGGEGAPWIGMTPFVDQTHIFQNIGDGTLFHSGYLAIEACVAAKVNITYKILYNGHVAMTGGQNAVGALPIPDADAQARGRGRAQDGGAGRGSRANMRRQASWPRTPNCVPAMSCRARCAKWKRFPASRPSSTTRSAPPKSAASDRAGSTRSRRMRLVINEEVCEGCGDCVEAGQLHEPDAGA